MPYKVQFLGLVCFYRDGQGRLAMLPDGTNPGPGIEEHHPRIIVDSDAITETRGWDQTARETGRFELPACDIVIEGADQSGVLDTTRHDNRLPSLGKIDRNFRIDPARARTIATMSIRQGKLEAFRVPRCNAAMSELEVPHDGPVRITIKPRDGSAERSITVAGGTEIAILNTADDYVAAEEDNKHFKIYERLSSRPVNLTQPDDSEAKKLQESTSLCAVFTTAMPYGLTASCSNTGCCP